jgi:hypothetical protein
MIRVGGALGLRSFRMSGLTEDRRGDLAAMIYSRVKPNEAHLQSRDRAASRAAGKVAVASALGARPN